MSEVAGWANKAGVQVPEGHPKPLLWRVLVMPVQPEERTKGGIMIARETQDAQRYLNYIGRIVDVGPLAWTSEKFAGMGEPPKIGDYVIYGRYAGQPLEFQEVKLLIVNDDEILAHAPDPDALRVYV